MWTKISIFILRNKLLLITAIFIFTIFMAYRATFVKLSYQYAALLPEKDIAYLNYQNFKNLFGDDANIIVIGIKDENLFELEKFKEWIKLGELITDLKGIENLVSVGNVYNLKKNSKLKKFELKKIINNEIKTQKELDSIKTVLYSLPFYKKILYNENAYLMAVTVNKKKFDSKEREAVVDSIEYFARAFAKKYNDEIHFSGLPYTRTLIAKKVKKELNMFIILAVLVTATILYLFFRSFKIVFFSILIVGIAVVSVMGSIDLFNFKITVLTGLIPPLLIVIGIPNFVFMINKYHQEYRKHGNQAKALVRMVQKIGNATFLTNLTTASGFATFILTSSEILQEFGIIASLNILGIFLFSLILIPIIFFSLEPPNQKQTKHLKNNLIAKIIKKLVFITENHRKTVYYMSFLIFIFAIIGIMKMKTTGFIVDDIPKDDPIYLDLKFFEKHFYGVMPLEIVIDTKRKKGVIKSSTLKKIEKLQEELKKYKSISKPLSLVEGIKFSRQAFFNGKEKHYKLPSNSEKNFILSYVSKDKNKKNLLRNFIDSTGQITRISYKVADIGTVGMRNLEKNIHKDLDSIFDKNKFKTIITGSSVVFVKGTTYLIKNLFTSLFIAISLIAVFMAFMFSSWRMVLISLIPNLFPLVLTAALMGYFGISIKPSTVLVFSIAFGISVDDTIHFLAKYRQELKFTEWNIHSSIITSLKETGFSMIYTSIVLFFGFGIFSASTFGGTVALGILVSVTLLIAMLSNLLLLPSLLITLEKMITTQAFKEPLLQIFDEEIDIELDKLKIKFK